MLHAGVGPTHVNTLLTSINIPAINMNTQKAREREIGPVVENVAEKSCMTALKQEKEQWQSTSIGVSYDMGWQKRGKGYNSLTGAGSMIGLKSGKVLCYGTRTKLCAICESSHREGKVPRSHDCRLNWNGSSKAMEPGLGAKLVQKLEQQLNTKVSVFVGDDDSSTIKKYEKLSAMMLKSGPTLFMPKGHLVPSYIVYNHNIKVN
ncbi:hypothetical protein QZH41_019950 [Actinostola sp. cb2023]|nr:hypothetical protein QZH41_019950 [Actinostola sp. cb2023]